MKLLQFFDNNELKLGIKIDEGIIDARTVADSMAVSIPFTMMDLINEGEEGKKKFTSLIEHVKNQKLPLLNEENLNFAPVIDKSNKIICIGLNYIPHVKESNMKIPEFPVVFSKFSNTLAGHNQPVTLPSVGEKYDYEAELVLVVGKEGKNINKDEALSYVYGYSIGNDLSARDLQMLSGQWLLGKTLDNFAPIGPYLVTSDEVDPNNLDIECKVNGEVRQSSNTKNMIFDCATLISYVSQYIKLEPGDIIFTGTPEGVILGYPEEKQIWLKSGDVVEVTISELGQLKNSLI